MTFEEITEEISIWNRWSYSFTRKEIICFTDKVISFDDKLEMWVITYKPKRWLGNVSFSDFWKLLKNPKLRETYRWFKSDWFTEFEKGEVLSEDFPDVTDKLDEF